MNIFQQFTEFMNARGFCNGAEEAIESHEDKEAAFARELAALLEKYGLELQEEEDEAYDDRYEDNYENESDEERAKKGVAEGFKEKREAKDEKDEARADKKIEEEELKENKDYKKDTKEYNNSGDFEYFKSRHNSIQTIKAAPAITFNSIEEQRKLGKEIF